MSTVLTFLVLSDLVGRLFLAAFLCSFFTVFFLVELGLHTGHEYWKLFAL